MRSLVHRGLALLGLALLLPAGQAQVFISEFQASNTRTLRDENGNAEDWIELYNAGGNEVDLAGWSLTDDPDSLKKWRFPTVLLGPNQFLVVFASGNDRRVPGSPLHTNFKLNIDGDYLALLKPDGTIANEFAPTFPPQADDLSFGLPVVAQTVSLLSPGAPGRFLVPRNDSLGAEWMASAFDDSWWTAVTNGVGFDTSGSSLTNLLGSRVDGAMLGVNSSAYVRFPFVVTNRTELDQLALRMRYDDGFAASLNGVLVASRNSPVASAGGIQADSLADWSNTGQQGFNNWYYGFYDQGADPDGAYDPYSDFTHADPQWSWNGGAWVLGPANPPWDLITASGWHPNGDNSGGVHWTIRRWVSETSGSITCRVNFAKENTACGNGTTLRVLHNGVQRFSRMIAFNDSSGIQTNLVLNDIQAGDFIDFALDPLGTEGSRGDGCDGCTFSLVIDQSASAGPTWDSVASVSRSLEQASTAEELSLARYQDWLVTGTNVLAIQGLNVSVSDPDFLVLPEIIGTHLELNAGQRVYFTQPTPGAANGPGSLTIGPVLSDVRHAPVMPADTEDLVVLARVTPSLGPVGSVTLKYRVMYGGESSTAMYDDGAHGDGAAGDLLFGGHIPASASRPGQMVRYYLVAADTTGRQTRSPAFPDPNRSPQYHGTVVFDPVLTNSRLPVLYWFLQNSGAADSDATARCSLFFDGEFYDNIGANIHGQSTRGFPKKSYDLDFNPGDHFRWSQDAPRVDDLNLLTTWADKTHMRNVLAHETYQDGGAPGHFAFAVRVQQNGVFFSVANVVENGDDNFLRRLGLDPNGALYKMYNSAESVAGAEKKTRKHEGTADLQALITGMSQSDATARQNFLFDHLDVPEMIDFLAAKMITADTDCCHKNYYLYRDSDGTGEWQAMPWDVDLCFGRVWTCGSPCLAYYDETIYTNQPITIGYGNIVFTPLYDTPATRQMFLRRLRTLMDALLQPPGTAVTNDFYRLKTQALRDQIAPDAALDLAKWGTWGATETLTQAVNRIWNEFLPGRRAFLFRTLSVTNGGEIPLPQPTNAVVRFDRLECRPASGNPLEEWLSLTNANNYAVDLSGWRLDGGVRFAFKPGTVIPSRAALFVSPDVKAFRARTVSPKGGERRLVVGPYDGDLSAWGESLTLEDSVGHLVSSNTFVGSPSLPQQHLRVTEIFYHPDPLPGNTNLDAQEFEFIELRNIGPMALDLLGVRFTEGVTFDFSAGGITNLAPGARVLVVRNPSAFALRYGAGLPVAGAFSGTLDNSGERLRLEDAFGEKILDFAYNNAWYPITDGHGFSLAIVDDTLHWSLWGERSSWRPNGTPGGAPGAEDPTLPALPPVLVNEVLAHTDPPLTDSIELHNPTSTNVDVGGWFLTDDFAVARKYRIPAPTLIPPGGFVCFNEAQFNAIPGTFPSFVLNSEGDDVWLFSAMASSNLTGYVQGFDFGATANAVSLGHYVNSVGDIDHPSQASRTLSFTNSGPLVGPIVISEIMYHPADTGSSNLPGSYLELANLAATNAPLCNPAEPTNTWRVRNAVDFDFPRDVVLAPGGRLLVVGFDPHANTTTLASFRALYGVGTNVPVYGPWSGRLGNREETIELKKPDPSGTNGVPYVMVEKVHYLDHDPWPAIADGAGASLQRRVLSAYANEPTNWFSATPTAGAPNQPNTLPTVRLNSPSEGSIYLNPTNVMLSATAADGDGSVQRVEFRAGGGKLGEAIVTPYAFTWTNPPPGQHVLSAVAVDDRLGSTVSAPVSITVVSQPPSVRLVEPADGTVLLVGSSLPISADASDADGQIDQVRLFAGTTLLTELFAPPYAFTWSGATVGTYPLTAVAVDSSGSMSTSAVATVAFAPGTNTATTLVSTGSRWKYLDNGSNQGTSWTRLDFDDSSWSSGGAQLGYDEGDETTPLSWGPDPNNKHITYYFRQAFQVTNAAAFRDLTVRLLRDDGALVYLNTNLVFRSNMPGGTVDFRTLASVAAAGTEETTYFPQTVSTSYLREGTNLLAVEVHQSATNSSDVSFDLSLAGTQQFVAPAILAQPVSRIVSLGGTVTFSVAAGGTGPLIYQWHFKGAPLPGAAGTSLVISNVRQADAGPYQVAISNSVGSTLSDPAVLALDNQPPVTGDDGLLVRQGQTGIVPVTSLLANDADPEHGNLVLSEVSSASDQGAIIELLSGQVSYTPAGQFVGSDRFLYTVADPEGLASTGRVEVLVYAGALPTSNELTILPATGGYRLRYHGTPGRGCEFRRSTDLQHWDPVLEVVIPPHGFVECLETNALTGGAYYRAVQP
jgi:hypothetical protein